MTPHARQIWQHRLTQERVRIIWAGERVIVAQPLGGAGCTFYWRASFLAAHTYSWGVSS
jgi:hypothetical protein